MNHNTQENYDKYRAGDKTEFHPVMELTGVGSQSPKENPFKLGDRVRVVSVEYGSHRSVANSLSKVGIVIGLHLAGPDYYVKDTTIALEGSTGSNGKPEKVQLGSEHLRKIETVRLVAYSSRTDLKLQWHSLELSKSLAAKLKLIRVPKFDMVKEI